MLRELYFQKLSFVGTIQPELYPWLPKKKGKKGLPAADPYSEKRSLNEKGKQNMGMQCGLFRYLYVIHFLISVSVSVMLKFFKSGEIGIGKNRFKVNRSIPSGNNTALS